MAKVTLNLLNIFALQLKKNSIEYVADTVGDVISQFVTEHKDLLDDKLLSKNKKKLNPQILILLNGKNVLYMKKYKTKLEDEDQLYISIALSGG